jgi:hypothetical protein
VQKQPANVPVAEFEQVFRRRVDVAHPMLAVQQHYGRIEIFQSGKGMGNRHPFVSSLRS